MSMYHHPPPRVRPFTSLERHKKPGRSGERISTTRMETADLAIADGFGCEQSARLLACVQQRGVGDGQGPRVAGARRCRPPSGCADSGPRSSSAQLVLPPGVRETYLGARAKKDDLCDCFLQMHARLAPAAITVSSADGR